MEYLERAKAFIKERYAKGLSVVDFHEFMNMCFPKEDWRSCPDPFRAEMLLHAEIWDMSFSKKTKPSRIARSLGISKSKVERLLREEFRYKRPVFFKPSEVLWPKGYPGSGAPLVRYISAYGP
jgi:hypothetical protein